MTEYHAQFKIVNPRTSEVIAEAGAHLDEAQLERVFQLGIWMASAIQLAARFDYETMGRNVGTFCPLQADVCALELAEPEGCPFGIAGCPDEWDSSPAWDLILTASGRVCPSPTG